MALPVQVQAALDAADATLAEANAPPVQPPAEPAEAPPDPFEPVPQAAPPVEVAVAPPAPKQMDENEARYKTLQGILNTAISTLQGQVKSLGSSVSEAVERLNQASAHREATPTIQAVDPKDADTFGEDLVNMVQRVAQGNLSRSAQAFDTKTAELEEKIAALTQRMTGTDQHVAANEEQTFFDKLVKQVPQWEQINADPGFLAWLAEADPVYGTPRQNALNEAQRLLNPERATAIFRAYAGPAKPEAARVDPLDKQLSPRSASSAAPVSADKSVVTQAQITAFYDGVRQGVYRGNPTEQARIELIINTALAEGRVR